MKIVVLNGSPRPNGNTQAMVAAFAEGAREQGHDVYEGAIYAYRKSFPEYLGVEDMGVFTAFGEQNKSPEKLQEQKDFGRGLV